MLKTGDAEGAAAGDYKVRIDPDSSIVPKAKAGVGLDTKSVPFPVQYTEADGDTGLTATVTSGPNQLAPFKLVATKIPVDMIVIDSAQKVPTAN